MHPNTCDLNLCVNWGSVRTVHVRADLSQLLSNPHPTMSLRNITKGQAMLSRW